MSVRLVRAVLLVVGLARVCPASAQQPEREDRQQRCVSAVPSNVDAGLLAAHVLALLRRSQTFRLQCERIAADPRVRMRLRVANAVAAGGRAQTALHRYPSGALVADVEILFGEDYRELLAHEFEHVLEQIDGVDLRREAAEGRAWEIAAGTFETRRAFRAGVQVLHEVDALRAHAGVTPAPAR